MLSNEDYEVLIVDSEVSASSFFEILIEDIKKSPSSESFITVDTEFIRENQPEPLLCLIQIATAQHAFVIDPLAKCKAENVNFFNFLAPILENSQILKVFHSAVQDIEILSTFGTVRNIYDTQLYEMLLSTKEQVSYQNLVRKYVGKRLDKTCVISDWKQRPLSKKQLRYSIGDVTFLRDIYKSQKSKLEQVGRLHWLKDEMLDMEEQVHKIRASSSVGNTAENIGKTDMAAIEQELSAWLQEKSKEKNITPKDIIGRQSIAKICRKGRGYVDKLLKYRGLKNKNFRNFLLFAKNVVPQNLNEKEAEELHFECHNNLVISALKLILEIASKNNNIAQSLIATIEDLKNLAEILKKEGVTSDVLNFKCLKDWRYEIFGRYAENFLKKKLSIAIGEGGEIVFKTEC